MSVELAARRVVAAVVSANDLDALLKKRGAGLSNEHLIPHQITT